MLPSRPVRSVPAVSQHQAAKRSNFGRAVAGRSRRVTFKTHSEGASTLMDWAVSEEFSNGSFSLAWTPRARSPKAAVSCAAFDLPQDTIEQAILKLARSSLRTPYRLVLILFFCFFSQARNQAEIQYQIEMANFSDLTDIFHIWFCVTMIAVPQLLVLPFHKDVVAGNGLFHLWFCPQHLYLLLCIAMGLVLSPMEHKQNGVTSNLTWL